MEKIKKGKMEMFDDREIEERKRLIRKITKKERRGRGKRQRIDIQERKRLMREIKKIEKGKRKTFEDRQTGDEKINKEKRKNKEWEGENFFMIEIQERKKLMKGRLRNGIEGKETNKSKKRNKKGTSHKSTRK